VPPVRVRLTAAKTGLRRHRKLRLARPPGLGLYLDLVRRSLPRPTPELGLDLDLERRSPPRPTPGARTLPRPRTTISASPGPWARTQPRPRTTISASPDPRAQTRPRPRRSLRLARPRARTDHVTRGPSLPYPYLAQAMGNKTGVPSGSPRETSNDGTPRAP
jgi:hypothetical protein